MHAGLIADLVQTFCSSEDCQVECLILGDVTYGACCIDDLASQKLGCDFIVHYGHSCLVPIPNMVISNVLYVFVEIGIDIRHLLESISFNIKPTQHIFLMGIVQFNTTLVRVKQLLEKEKGFTNIELP
jgi:2-(3-amino-3-carboxypropyl)histidine synthase